VHTGKGNCGIKCRGEEHEVELVWSVVSDKIKLFWNKRKINHCIQASRIPWKLDLTWEYMSGQKFRILAKESPNQSAPQYDLFIDSISIFSLPHVSELSRAIITVDNKVRFDELSETSMDSYSSDESNMSFDSGMRQASALEFESSIFPSCDPLHDDLTPSWSLTNILEYLRGVITTLIPNSVDMVSKSIINALLEDKSACEHHTGNSLGVASSITLIGITPTEIKANLFYETMNWIDLHSDSYHQFDAQEQKRLFLQKQMDNVFMHARHERLSEDTAAQTLIDIATLLGFPICLSVKREPDTIIIRDLKNEITSETLNDATKGFEELLEVGVASNRFFGFCRFASARGPIRALAAADQGTLVLNGSQPSISLLQNPSMVVRPTPLSSRSVQKEHTRRRSHQRNTISVDTLIVESPPFLRLMNEMTPSSPL